MLISHRVVLIIWYIVIVIRSLCRLFTKYGTLLSLVKWLFWVSNLHTYTCILLPGHPKWNHKYLHHFSYFHIMISLIQVQNLSNFMVSWEAKSELNIFRGIDWMYMASIIQVDIKYSQFRKTDGNIYWRKVCLFIDMICSVMVDCLFKHMVKYIVYYPLFWCV